MLVRGLGLAGLLALAACGGGEESSSSAPAAPAAASAPAPQAAAPAPTAAAPAAAPACEVPEGELKGDCAVGAEQYAIICSTCHGTGGKGDGPGALGLDPKPRDHTDAAYMATLENADLYKVIKCGGVAVGKSPMMAAWGGSLTEDQNMGLVCHLHDLYGT